MKIFNWVHRKFHHPNTNGYMLSHKNDGLACYDVKKPETVTNEADTEALLDQVTDLIDVWKHGILTIGTLGYDPLIDRQIDYSIIKHNEEDDYEEEEEEEKKEEDDEDETYRVNKDHAEVALNPLVVKAFKREIEKVLGADTGGSKPDTLRVTVDDETDMPLLPFFESPELKCESEEKDKMKKRMTLADLFSAEPNVNNGKSDSGETSPDSGKKPGCNNTKNNGLSFAKKLMPRKGEESRPIRKLHKMITKMLKKKIHPELEGQAQVKEGSSGPSKIVILPQSCTHKPSHGTVTMESVSLLREVVTQC